MAADSYRVMRLLSARADPERSSITVSFLGLRPRTAVYYPELGATLIHGGVRPPVRTISAPRENNSPWPVRRQTTRIAEFLDRAVSEPDRKRLRRTRAVVIVHDGQIVGERYADGFSEHTRLPGWSMTKSVLSALIGVLVGEGRVAPKNRALLPDWRPPDPRAAITLEDLLRMRSGLRFSEVYEDLSSDVIEMLFNRADAAGYAATAGRRAWDDVELLERSTNILPHRARRRRRECAEWPQRAPIESGCRAR